MDITEFAQEITVPVAMCFSSRRMTGKSVMLNQLMKSLIDQGKIATVVIFSNSVKYNDDYPDFPERSKHEYSEEKLQRIIDHQKSTPKEKRKQIMVVFDDIVGDRSATNSDLIMFAYAIGRHISINPVLVSQVSNRVLTPMVKSQSDYLFISRLNRFQLGGIWESLTNIDKQEFIGMVEHCNKNYNFVVIDNKSQSNNPEDFITIVRAKDPDERKRAGKDDDNDGEKNVITK
jgi:hypothetical protein